MLKMHSLMETSEQFTKNLTLIGLMLWANVRKSYER